MRKFIRFLFLSIFLLSISSSLNAQNYRFEVGLGLGVSNCLGDIGGKFLPRRNFVNDLRFQYTGMSGRVGLKYALTPRINLGGNFTYARISGEDSLSTNPGRNQRNLSFRNNILEFSAIADIELYEKYNVGRNSRYRSDFRFFLQVGIGYFTHNPQARFNAENIPSITGSAETFSYSGWHELAPLKTEGQAAPYKLSGLSTILGLGFDFTLDRNYRIGFNIGVRTTNTDYLDDISGRYNMDALLVANRYPNAKDATLAYYLADRAGEKNPAADYDRTGFPRGNSKYQDSYVVSTINFAYVFKGKGAKRKRAFTSNYVKRNGSKIASQYFSF